MSKKIKPTKISELISELERIQSVMGDLPVMVPMGITGNFMRMGYIGWVRVTDSHENKNLMPGNEWREHHGHRDAEPEKQTFRAVVIQ